VVGDMRMLVTGVTDNVMVVFIFVVGDVPMLVIGGVMCSSSSWSVTW
jgi:hypothetical protein